jgi:hypothetical protein
MVVNGIIELNWRFIILANSRIVNNGLELVKTNSVKSKEIIKIDRIDKFILKICKLG